MIRIPVLASVRRFIGASAILLLAVLTPGIPPQVVAADTEVVRQSATLKVANRPIIVLRGPTLGYTAEERVRNTTERIERALEAEAYPPITFEEAKDYASTRVLLGGKHAFLVTRIDIDEQAGETTQGLAKAAAARLELAIRERREQETPRYLAVQAVYAVVSTLLYGVLLWLIYRVNRWAGGRLSMAARARSRDIPIGGVPVVDASHLLLVARRVIIVATWVLVLVLATGWLTFVLVQFPYTRPWGEGLEGNLIEILKQIVLAIAGAVPGLLFVVVIVVIARIIIRFGRIFFSRVEAGRIEVGWLDSDTARPTRRIAEFVVWLFALAMAYPYLPGAQSEAFKGLSVLAGLMVTIGASSVVGQAFSGLILMYTKAFRSGDYVRIGDTEGTVMYLGMFTTRIRTGLGEEITLPNSHVMAGSMKNYSRAVPGTGYVLDTVVTIGYTAPWRQVHAMLDEAARRTAAIAAAPPPMVRQTALSDFYVEYRLIAYTPVASPGERIEVLHELHGHIQDVFNEYGVQIMSPHYMMDPKEPQVVAKKDWHAAPARPPEKQ